MISSPDLLDYLRYSGFSQKSISKMTPETRLYHDLDYDGDTAEEMMNFLSERYNVDMSSFEFDLYFPREFPGTSRYIRLLISLFPFFRLLYNKRKTFLPLRLSMIDEAIKRKEWKTEYFK